MKEKRNKRKFQDLSRKEISKIMRSERKSRARLQNSRFRPFSEGAKRRKRDPRV